MKEQIERAFLPLVGQPLRGAGRAVDMETFGFGPLETVTTRQRHTRTVGTLALHVQCAWRIVGPKGIIVASRDRYTPSESSGFEQDDPDFVWDESGANLCDERRDQFFSNHQGDPLCVSGIHADDVGSVTLLLGDGYRLDVFPDDSQSGEHWRFFQRHDRTSHFVVTGGGIKD